MKYASTIKFLKRTVNELEYKVKDLEENIQANLDVPYHVEECVHDVNRYSEEINFVKMLIKNIENL